jgi:hypothetical protein
MRVESSCVTGLEAANYPKAEAKELQDVSFDRQLHDGAIAVGSQYRIVLR